MSCFRSLPQAPLILPLGRDNRRRSQRAGERSGASKSVPNSSTGTLACVPPWTRFQHSTAVSKASNDSICRLIQISEGTPKERQTTSSLGLEFKENAEMLKR